MSSVVTQDGGAKSNAYKSNYESHIPAIASVCTPLKTADLLEEATSLKGKVILVTGGASGIGAAFATFAASQGAHVVISDLTEHSIKAREKEIIDSICTDLAVAGPATNVTKWEDLLNLFDFVDKKYGGRLDAVVSCAGIPEPDPGFDIDQYDENGRLKPPTLAAVDINLKGSMLTTKLALHYMRKQPAQTGQVKSIILLGSMSSFFGIPMGSTYASSKHGILGFMRSIFYTAQPDGISVSAVLPWFTDTPIVRVAPRLLLAGLPFAKMTDVVNAIVFATTMRRAAGTALAVDPEGVMLLPHEVNEHGEGGFHTLFSKRAMILISTIRSIRIALTIIATAFTRSTLGIFLISTVVAYLGYRQFS